MDLERIERTIQNYEKKMSVMSEYFKRMSRLSEGARNEFNEIDRETSRKEEIQKYPPLPNGEKFRSEEPGVPRLRIHAHPKMVWNCHAMDAQKGNVFRDTDNGELWQLHRVTSLDLFFIEPSITVLEEES